ncbi:MAG: DUF389 domain-containing protein [Chlorobiales bacterium]|nr:DUF389 domain-containing protein [Chlorobiales bacterium]
MIKTILHSFNIQQDAETFDVIHSAVEREIVFKGSRLWVLIFAIILASVGLNINSTSVIIGAMLISPLMGPINGIGYSIATYDFPLLRQAFKNFSFAVLASLVASTLYFAISPVSSAHSELLARTSPTIYDVLIALFGGLAGTISLTTRLKGNVVPGVAIATALMPPLCTAGYGLATGQFQFFFGAIYLFTINTVFIGISTIVFSQVMAFPIKAIIDEAKKARINHLITVVILITLIPSVYFGYVLVQNEGFSENSAKFVRSISLFRGNYLLRHEINVDHRTITLMYGGRKLTADDKMQLKKRSGDFGLSEATLNFQQGINFADFSNIQLSETERLKSEINRLSLELQQYSRQQDSLYQRRLKGGALLSELRVLFPVINACLFTEPYRFIAAKPTVPIRQAYVIVTTSKSLRKNEKEKITLWLRARLQNDSLRTVFD